MKEFEVGEIVRVKTDDGYRIGEVVFRDECPEDWGEDGLYVVKFNDDEFDTEWYTPEEMEKNEEENTMTENRLVEEVEYTGKFKAGDRVRVIAATEKSGLEGVGKTGTLRATFSKFEDAPYYIEYDDGGGRYFNEACFELLSRVTHEDFSKEYTAVAFLLRHKGDKVREYLLNEINSFARMYLKNHDYNNAREAMDVAEALKERTK